MHFFGLRVKIAVWKMGGIMHQIYLVSFLFIFLVALPMWYNVHLKKQYGTRGFWLMLSLLVFAGTPVVAEIPVFLNAGTPASRDLFKFVWFSLAYSIAFFLLETSVHIQRIRDSFVLPDFRDRLKSIVIFPVLQCVLLVLCVIDVFITPILGATWTGGVGIVSLLMLLIPGLISAFTLFSFQKGILRDRQYPFVSLVAIVFISSFLRLFPIVPIRQLGLDVYLLVNAVFLVRIFEEYFFFRMVHLNEMHRQVLRTVNIRNDLIDRIISSPVADDYKIVRTLVSEELERIASELPLPQYKVTAAVIYKLQGTDLVVQNRDCIIGYCTPLSVLESFKQQDQEHIAHFIMNLEFSIPSLTSQSSFPARNFGMPHIKKMLETREPVFIRDLPSQYTGVHKLVALYPVLHRDQVTGMVVLYKEAFSHMFPAENKAFHDLTDNLNTLYMIMDGKRQQEERNRLEGEIQIARNIQTNILPRSVAIDGYTVAASMTTATEVGGDMYDVYPSPDGAYFAIGDVSGHGLPAGIMAVLQTSAFHAALVTAKTLKKKLELNDLYDIVNKVLCTVNRDRLGNEKFMTCNYLQEKNGKITHVGAHVEALVYRAGSQTVEPIVGTINKTAFLGISEYIESSTSLGSFELEAGDTLVLYTDGAIEAKNYEGRQFDIEGLSKCIANYAPEGPEVLIEKTVETIHEFARTGDIAKNKGALSDDITFLVLRKD